MRLLGWLKAVLSVAIALAIGLALTGIVNLLVPEVTIGWTLGVVLAGSVLSALAAFLVAGGARKPAAPARARDEAPAKDAPPRAKNG